MADNGWAAFERMLKNYGLGELAAWAKQQFTEGRSPDEITLALEEQPAFQRKYAAIFDRRAKGLPPISVTDIMQYRQQALNLERFYDLPAGMISDDAQVNTAIGSDVSFAELEHRVTLGASVALQQPPEVLDWLEQNFGFGAGGVIAYFVDPTHAMPYIERAVASGVVAGASARQGFGALSRAEAERLAQAGVTADQASQAFGELAQSKELLSALAGTAESEIGRDTQLGVVEGEAGSIAALQRRARERVAAGKGGGSYAGKGLVSGTDR
jgi:hypothetical protein